MVSRQDLNPRPICHKSDTLHIALPPNAICMYHNQIVMFSLYLNIYLTFFFLYVSNFL